MSVVLAVADTDCTWLVSDSAFIEGELLYLGYKLCEPAPGLAFGLVGEPSIARDICLVLEQYTPTGIRETSLIEMAQELENELEPRFKESDFGILLANGQGYLAIDSNGTILEDQRGYMAIGEGAGLAMAAMGALLESQPVAVGFERSMSLRDLAFTSVSMACDLSTQCSTPVHVICVRTPEVEEDE